MPPAQFSGSSVSRPKGIEFPIGVALGLVGLALALAVPVVDWSGWEVPCSVIIILGVAALVCVAGAVWFFAQAVRRYRATAGVPIRLAERVETTTWAVSGPFGFKVERAKETRFDLGDQV